MKSEKKLGEKTIDEEDNEQIKEANSEQKLKENIIVNDKDQLKLGKQDNRKENENENQTLQIAKIKKLKQQDLYDFGIVLYSLSELQSIPEDLDQIFTLQQYSSQSHTQKHFSHLHDGFVKQLTLSLLNNDPSQRPSAEELLAKPEIQDRINSWIQQPSLLPPSSKKMTQIYFSSYRARLAQILVQFVRNPNDDKFKQEQIAKFDELANILKWAHEQRKDISRPIQEWICNVLICVAQYQNLYFSSSHTEVLILQELKTLFGSDLALEEVKLIHAQALYQFSQTLISDNIELIHSIGLVQQIIRIINSSKSDVSEQIILTILHIIMFQETFSNEQNWILIVESYQVNNIVDTLFKNGVQKGQTENIKLFSASCIGHIFKLKELPDEMKSVIISFLKRGLKNEDIQIQIFSSSALVCLVRNGGIEYIIFLQQYILSLISANCSEILNNNFIDESLQIINENQEKYICEILKLMSALIEFGTEETQYAVKQALQPQIVRQLTWNKQSHVREMAFILLSWILNTNQMLRFKALKKEISRKNFEEYQLLPIDDIVNEIYDVLNKAKESYDTKDIGGLIVSAVEIISEFIYFIDEFPKILIEDNGIFDIHIQFYDSISPKQITINQVYIFSIIINNSIPQLYMQLRKEKYITSLVRLLDCLDTFIIDDLLNSISRILINTKETGEVQKEDEFRQIMIKNGGMNKLVQYFFDYEIDSSCKDIVAIAIGSINAAVQIPDEFRGAVICHLKKIKEDSDILQLIGKSLAGLAKNIGNHNDIMSDNFEHFILNLLLNDDEEIVFESLKIILNIFEFGSQYTQQKLKDILPWRIVHEKMNSPSFQIQRTSILLNNWEMFLS